MKNNMKEERELRESQSPYEVRKAYEWEVKRINRMMFWRRVKEVGILLLVFATIATIVYLFTKDSLN